MFPHDLGTNRLRSGFRRRSVQRSASHPGTPSDSDDDSATSVRNLETEDEEVGGMTLNLQAHGDGASPIVISDDDDVEELVTAPSIQSDLEEGEERESADGEPKKEELNTIEADRARQASDVSFIIDTTPGPQQTCLKDLNSTQLKNQIKYAFWQFPRDQIDLSRFVRCLNCQAEGHIDEACPEKTCIHCGAYAEHDSILCPSVKRCQRCREHGHSACQGVKNNTVPCDICTLPGHTEDRCPVKHYNRHAIPPTAQLNLWISCCICASKSHLVGDCPEASAAKALRWSLRSLDPNKIVNLNLQTGIEKREREAANRNMRPEGMKIRGRASRHNADSIRYDPSENDDHESVFNHPPRRRDNKQYAPSTRPLRGAGPRYDRYEGHIDTYRPPRNEFYATDSFGRPRSRSPPRRGHRAHVRSRSQSPPHRTPDNYASDRLSPPEAKGKPPKKQIPQNPHQKPLSRDLSIKLPTRKGSNSNISNIAPAAVPPKPTTTSQPGTNGDSSKQDGSSAITYSSQPSHTSLPRSQRRKFKKKNKENTQS